MKHWTKIEHDARLPSLRVAGIRMVVDGAARCLLEVSTDTGSRFFGGPITDNRRLTEYATDADMIAFRPSHGTFYLPAVLYARDVILQHESADGQRYTLQDFRPIHFGRDDYDDIDPIFAPAAEIGTGHTGARPFLTPRIRVEDLQSINSVPFVRITIDHRAATGATQRLVCATCGDAPPPGARFCIKCGASVHPTTSAA